ncbi:L-lactate permease [Psittacicella gerlachiana]|uniref:L-lactate permease n=1 Tax=Psittacicella gerlachiana TaxID=2028574 RepID=A0A3A1YA92_9GAMM|nr:L-lactate permease [Psittacicella gerlachiana]RIY34595.1 lactate permease [Psittacicella gerlachiana]
MSGTVLQFILSVFPILLLIFLMAKRNGLPSYIALPITGALILVIQLVYWGNSGDRISASVVASFVATLVPVTIIFAAILFNRFMEISGSIKVIKSWLASVSPNPVAQLMIIGWAFAFMIEGASGFGTPAAIAAPLLVSLGFPAIQVCILTLIMNSVPVSFGAVGTPTWYGFSQLADFTSFTELGSKTAIIHAFASLVIPVVALLFVVKWSEVKRNLGFVYLSVIFCVVPYLLIAQVNDEFPSLVGGAIGMLLSVWAAKKGLGLSKSANETDKLEQFEPVTGKQVAKALMPFAILIGLLIVTRVQQLPFKAAMNSTAELFTLGLGFADLTVTKSLTFGLNNIFGTGIGDSYKLLYVPCLIPFVVTVLFCQFFYNESKGQVVGIFKESVSSVKLTYVALFGAFVMVKLMMLTPAPDNNIKLSMVSVIGHVFSDSMGGAWLYVASYLGAVGAFFSGSNTVSNLTFGSIQQSIAQQIGASQTTVLALQSVGGAMGNMVCLNNIIAVASVTNCLSHEGYILKRTFIPMVIYGIIAAVVYQVAAILFPGFWL